MEESKSSLMIGEETKKAMEAEEIKKATEKWSKLEVYATAEEVQKCKPGDRVYLSSYLLQNPELVPIGEDFKIMVNESDIDIVW